MIDFYSGINETAWNGYPVSPGELACISPVFGKTIETKKENPVRVPPYSIIIQDSGAFCDGLGERLSFQEAFDRQLKHSAKYKYSSQVESQASYDLLIDEKWESGVRYKRRWTESEAWQAVNETVEAAKFISEQNIKSRVLSAQGVTANQYKECTLRVLEYFDFENDIFGLGGWCISGMMSRQIRPAFNSTMLEVIPLLGQSGIKRVHIWGVIDITFLAPLLWLCDQSNIKLSTDSAGPQKRPIFNSWGYRDWSNRKYKRPQGNPFLIGLHRALHVEYVRDWLKNDVRKSRFYKKPWEPVFMEDIF
jgi:hypothetical protein